MNAYPSRFVAMAAITIVLSASSLARTIQEDPDTPAPRPRSVFFYVIDTCRSDRMGFDGYERETTPFLDWLAERAVVFENCTSQAPWTKPSMASMLTSQYPSATGVYKMDHRLPEELVTWPEVLQANGMYTAGFSANIVMGNTLSNFAQGFDHFTESTQINRADPIRFASGSARKLNEHVFSWLDGNDPWPMLLYLHSVDPHEEYEPEPQYLERFADPDRHSRFREEWKELLASRPPIPGLFVTQENFDRTGIDPESFLTHGSNLYDADILANDGQMKLLWDELQEEGWGEDLIFVFTSDHGEEFFDHGGTSHGYSLYEEMIRVPLMIYAPGLLPAGKRIETPVRSLDIYPTLCELLGFEVPEGLEGESLVPLIEGRAAASDRIIFSEHREDPIVRRLGQGSGVMVSLRSGRWKFILNETSSQLLEKPRFELYDLEDDPFERLNVADRHPEVVRRFEVEVATFVADHREGASARDWVTADPEVLAQLRELGYIGEEEELMETAPTLWEAIEALATVLLDAGADVDGRNTDGSTPLMGAAFLGRVDVLALLLERGADPTVKNANGDDPIGVTSAPWDVTAYIAGLLRIEVDREEVEEGRAECARLLQAAETSPDDPTARLFDAVRSGEVAGVEAALSEGASLKDWHPRSGWTPLYSAVHGGNAEVTRLLLDRGAKVHARTRSMDTSLHAAALLGHRGIAELLIERGADVDARDAKGATPLHAAAFPGHAETVGCLLREGADERMRDESGRTALDLMAIDWPSTEQALRLLGLELEREEVEAGRAAVAALLSD